MSNKRDKDQDFPTLAQWERPVGPVCLLQFFTLGGVVTVLEVVLLGVADSGEGYWLDALGLHLCLVGALAAATWLSRGDRLLYNMLWVLTIGTAFLGGLGSFGAVAAMGLLLIFRRSAIPYQQWYRELFPDLFENPVQEMAERLRRQGEQVGEGVIPFHDVMQFGSLREKQAVVSMINQHFHPAFAPILRMAFRDPNNALRVQAASVMTLIEETFLKKSMALEQEVEGGAHDPDLLLRYARHYDEYAYTGLLDPERERENRAKAVQAYRQVLSVRFGDLPARLALGRIMIREGQVEGAAALMEETFELGMVSEPMLLWYFESLFRLGRFDELERVILEHGRTFMEGERYAHNVLEALQLWCVPCRP